MILLCSRQIKNDMLEMMRLRIENRESECLAKEQVRFVPSGKVTNTLPQWYRSTIVHAHNPRFFGPSFHLLSVTLRSRHVLSSRHMLNAIFMVTHAHRYCIVPGIFSPLFNHCPKLHSAFPVAILAVLLNDNASAWFLLALINVKDPGSARMYEAGHTCEGLTSG